MLASLSKDQTLTRARGLRGSMKRKRVLQPFRSLGVSGPRPPLPLRSLIEKNLPGLGWAVGLPPAPSLTLQACLQPSLSLWAREGSSQNSQQASCPWGASRPASINPLFGLRGTPTSQPLPRHLVGVFCPESVFGRGLRAEALVRRCPRPLQWSGARILCLLTFSHPS